MSTLDGAGCVRGPSSADTCAMTALTRLMVLAGAAALAGSLWMAWYGDVTAWDALGDTNHVLVALALAGAFATFADVRPIVRLAGLAAVGLVTAKLIDRPEPEQLLALRTGAWVALGGAAAMLLGSLSADA
jgi:hypothetical protein